MSSNEAFAYLDHWVMTKPIPEMNRKEKMDAIRILEAAISCGPRLGLYVQRIESLRKAIRWKRKKEDNTPEPTQDVLWDIPLKRKKRS